MIAIVDENNVKTGETKEFEEVHLEGLLHRSAHIWVINKEGEVIVQKRGKNMSRFPGYLDISAAGHVSADESESEAALKELGEELGIKISEEELGSPTILKGKPTQYKEYTENEFYYLYFIKLDVDEKDIVIQESEVESVIFMKYDDFVESFINDSGKWCPHGKEYDELVVEKLGELVK